MKYFYLVTLFCCGADFFVMHSAVSTGEDIMFPGLYYLIIFGMAIYTALIWGLMFRWKLHDRRPVLLAVLSVPCFFYVLIHIVGWTSKLSDLFR